MPRPAEIVVMSRETDTPTLRAALRHDGMYIPPAFARADWGPAAIREAVRVRDEHDAGSPQGAAPTVGAGPVSSPQPPASTPGGFPQASTQPPSGHDEFSTDDRGYDPDLPPTGAYPIGDEPGAAQYDALDENRTPPGPADAFPGYEDGGRGDQDFDPPTAQINVAQAQKLADQISAQQSAGDSTTQASHRTERLDLSDWGYLLRVNMIADPGTPEPRQALEQMAPAIGDWLRHQIQQPARLEYDRRFRVDIEKMLAKFLTERQPRFPVIKAELQYID